MKRLLPLLFLFLLGCGSAPSEEPQVYTVRVLKVGREAGGERYCLRTVTEVGGNMRLFLVPATGRVPAVGERWEVEVQKGQCRFLQRLEENK
jgi:hypothetical protein